MKLIIGLGNPEQEYAHTKHNIGFDFIETWMKSKSYYEDLDICPGFYSSKSNDIKLLKPNTGMNNSGVVVRAVAHAIEIEPQDIIIVYDDIDFDIGKFKISVNGSTRHNGIKSILANTQDGFTRVRVGIGSPSQDITILDYVLSKFNDHARIKIDSLLERLVEVVGVITTDGAGRAMGLYNNKPLI